MSKVKINSKSLICLVIAVLILIMLYVIFGKLNDVVVTEGLLKTLSITALVIWTIFVINCIMNKVSISNLYFLYLLMYGIFIFGYIICKYILGYIDTEAFDLNDFIGEEYLAQGIILSIYCLIGLHIGYLVSKLIKADKENKNKEKENEDVYNRKISQKVMKNIAVVLIIISLPFMLLSTIDDFRLASVYGYEGVNSITRVGLSSISSKIEPFFFIGLMLLMASYVPNKNRCRLILIFIIAYNFILMFLGSRGINILRMLVAVIFYHAKVKKFNYKNIIVACILVTFLVNVMSIIRSFRRYGLNEWLPNIDKILVESMGDNALLKIINEMGGAIFPTAATIDYMESVKEFKYGTTYLYGLTTFIPNFFGGVHSAVEKSDTQAMVGNYFGLAFGGSVVQEAYINFGWYSWIFMIGLGYVLSKVSDKILKSDNLTVYALFCVFMVNFLWTIRNNIMSGLYRDIFWYLIPLYIIYKLIYNGRKKKQNEENKCIDTSL